jgi:hypothetical protein
MLPAPPIVAACVDANRFATAIVASATAYMTRGANGAAGANGVGAQYVFAILNSPNFVVILVYSKVNAIANFFADRTN